MSFKKITLLLVIAFSSYQVHSGMKPFKRPSIRNSLYASVLGDALGRVTEFISSTEEIFNTYPNGVRSFADFSKEDWQGLPEAYSPLNKAPYTDDTRMALLVTETLIESRKHNWDLEKTMSEIAHSFIDDMNDTTYGWAAPFRAPGNACLKGVRTLAHRRFFQHTSKANWWNVQASQAGGCGSVMRAFPFGLVFSNNPDQAKLWAVEHSKLTHGHPIALAACAAMAVGTAACVTNNTVQDILDAMIHAAEEYDTGTAQKIRKAITYAKEVKAMLNKKGKGRPQFIKLDITRALKNAQFLTFHDKVFNEFQGWAAHDAIAAAAYVFALFPHDIRSALYVAVHTPGDSDSIAAMAGALVGAYSVYCFSPMFMIHKIEDYDRIKNLADQIDEVRTC